MNLSYKSSSQWLKKPIPLTPYLPLTIESLHSDVITLKLVSISNSWQPITLGIKFQIFIMVSDLSEVIYHALTIYYIPDMNTWQEYTCRKPYFLSLCLAPSPEVCKTCLFHQNFWSILLQPQACSNPLYFQ